MRWTTGAWGLCVSLGMLTAAHAGMVFDMVEQIPLGVETTGVAGADFDGDGDQDFAVTSESANVVIILRGTPQGLIPDAPISLPGGPREVEAADMNGDGAADLVTFNRTAKTLSVLLNGMGSFSSAQSFALQSSAWRMVVARLNVDLASDVVVINWQYPQQSSVSFLMNDGTGILGAPVTQTSLAGARAIDTGDIDGDGDTDIAARIEATNGSASCSIRFNNGAGVFSAGPQISGWSHGSPFLVDLTNDGRADLATTSYGEIRTFVSLGTTLASPSVFSITPFSSLELCGAEDLDGDGDTDLLAAGGYYSDIIFPVLNTGSGSLAAGQTIGVAPWVSPTAFGFIDQDECTDVVAAGANGAVAIVHTANQGRFASPMLVSPEESFVGIAAFDVDGDHDCDAVTWRRNGTAAELDTFHNDGSGSLAFAASLEVASFHPYLMSPADFNGDGRVDLAFSGDLAENTVALALAGPNGDLERTVNATETRRVWTMAACDLDDDGDVDLVCGQGEGRQMLSLAFNNGSAEFTVRTLPCPYGPWGSVVGDFTGDGLTDIAMGCLGSLQDTYDLCLYRATTRGVFASPEILQALGGQDLAAGDIDGDSDLDFATMADAAIPIQIVTPASPGAYAGAPVQRVSAPRGGNPRLADIDRDGDLEFIASAGGALVAFRESGSHALPVILGMGGDGAQVTPADMDGDGDLDLVAANYGGGVSVRLYTGQGGVPVDLSLFGAD